MLEANLTNAALKLCQAVGFRTLREWCESPRSLEDLKQGLEAAIAAEKEKES